MSNPVSRGLKKYLIDPISQEVEKKLDSKLEKFSVSDQVRQLGIDPLMFNTRGNPTLKEQPEQTISINTLRDFSINYPIARACIDYLSSKIVQLKWDVTSEEDDDGDDVNQEAVKKVKMFLKSPSGYGSRFRNLLEIMIEDYLVVGAVALEKIKTYRGNLSELLPVDPSTIKLLLDKNGRTPQPPEVAFEQWILGKRTASLTADELLYEKRKPRSSSPFGLSPLESLILQIQSALRGAIYNYEFFNDSNVPEGFVTMPDNYNIDQVKQFQSHFDAIVAGDPSVMRRLRFLPYGVEYTQTKKPDDMSFERFEKWLLGQTCSVFGVPPQDIGFTFDTNRATSETQADKGDERGKRPLMMFISDIFTDIIQKDLGYTDLCFRFVEVDKIDLKAEAEVDEIRLRTGVISVDEIRRRDGLEEIGLSNYVVSGGNTILVSDLLKEKDIVDTSADVNNQKDSGEQDMQDSEDSGEEDISEAEKSELRVWKKCAIKDFKDGRFREFKTDLISKKIKEDINKQLSDASSKDDIVKAFEVYLSGEYKILNQLRALTDELRKGL